MSRLNRYDLSGKNALVNGADFPGGAEIAAGLCQAGATVYLSGASQDALDRVATDLAARGLQTAGLFLYEPGTEEAALALLAWIRAACGAPDILVDHTAHALHKGWDLSFEDIYNDLKRTQLGLMLTTRHIGGLMAGQGRGSVIFTTDYAALVGCDVHLYDTAPERFDDDFSLTYGFIKGSLVNYTRQAAGYLGEHRVRCNCLAFAPLEGSAPRGFADAFIRHAHLKRLASADDIMGAVVFLASDASAYITGVTLPVDGGYTAK